MTCGEIPDTKARRAIEMSKETGKEYGFSMCRRRIGPGWITSRMASGTDDQLDVPEPGILSWGLNCGDEAKIFHTHPPKHTLEPSTGDKAAVDYGPADEICASDFDGDVLCYDGSDELRRCEIPLNNDD